MRSKPKAALLLGALLFGPTLARAQEPALCRSSLACLQQMVDDIREYRTYLEDQLSLAKSLLQAANQRIAQLSKPGNVGECLFAEDVQAGRPAWKPCQPTPETKPLPPKP